MARTGALRNRSSRQRSLRAFNDLSIASRPTRISLSSPNCGLIASRCRIDSFNLIRCLVIRYAKTTLKQAQRPTSQCTSTVLFRLSITVPILVCLVTHFAALSMNSMHCFSIGATTYHELETPVPCCISALTSHSSTVSAPSDVSIQRSMGSFCPMIIVRGHLA